MTGGLMYFPRMLAKIRMHGCGNLPTDYHENFGKQKAGDGMMCNPCASTTPGSASSS